MVTDIVKALFAKTLNQFISHTLIDTDLLVESSIATLKKSPWLVALYPFWLLQGKGYLKAQLIKHPYCVKTG
jgi:hypothetical protein